MAAIGRPAAAAEPRRKAGTPLNYRYRFFCLFSTSQESRSRIEHVLPDPVPPIQAMIL